MIFYFTGTGNSLYAAQKLQESSQEKLVDIGETVRSRKFTYETAPGEKVGFVFPVYFWGLPNIVSWFIKKLELTGSEPEYTYALLTCGNSVGGADQMLRRELETAGYRLDTVFTLKMPDNYVLMLDIPSEEEQKSILDAAEIELEKIKEAVNSCSPEGYTSGIREKLLSTAAYSLYRHGRKTAKFYTDDRCVGCGACAKRCPCNAIAMVDGKPIWVKDRCIHCLACTNRCSAIQYGKGTVERERYVHPILKKNKHTQH